MLELPPSLRITVTADRLEAGGRRAHAVEHEGALHVTVDRRAALLELDPPLRSGDTTHWPFAAERLGLRLFAAPDQPVVVLDRDLPGSTQRVSVRGNEGLVVRVNGVVVKDEAAVDGHVRITVHAGDAPDVEALLGGAVARARRRASVRPRLAASGTASDPIALAEHRLRLELAAAARLGAHDATLAALALLAVNDEKAALDVVLARETEIASDRSCAVTLAGAWSAWRGMAIGARSVRESAGQGPASVPHTDDAWSQAARALAPFCSDVIRGAAGHASSAGATPDPARALAALADGEDRVGPAAELLRLLHGELGIMPDAMQARIRLAPRLRAGSLRIDQIAVADAVFLVHAEVGAEEAAIEVEQTSGATPFTAIVEPWLAGRRLREALVEDVRADLASTDEEGGIRPRVQLIIDRRRRLVLNFERR